MEAAFDDAIAKLKAPQQPKPQAPDPEQIKAEAAMQLEQMRQQSEQGKLQVSAQIEQFKAQNSGQIEQMKMQHATELEQMKQAAETERAKYKTDVDAQVRLQIAAMQDQQSKEARAFEAEKYNADGQREAEREQRESERAESEKVDLSPVVESMNKLGEQVAEIQAYVTAPVKIERDPKTGRAVGVNRGGVVKPIKRGADGRMEGI
jgi:vacuolar-type H+-ATPase subunit I/STV1